MMRHVGNDATLTREQIEKFVRHWDEHGFGLWAMEGERPVRRRSET